MNPDKQNQDLKNYITMILQEDCVQEDITTHSFIQTKHPITAQIILKQDGCFFGHNFAKNCCLFFSDKSRYKPQATEGVWLKKGSLIAQINMDMTHLMKIERCMLNCLQHLSGVASYTYLMKEKIKHLPIELLGTRKTTPLLRDLEIQAIQSVGGNIHRRDLSSAILIKENHIHCFRKQNKILNKVDALKQMLSSIQKTNKKIGVEINTVSEIPPLFEYEVDVILCDNMSVIDVKKVIHEIKKKSLKTKIEVSGNINLKNIDQWTFAGINRISSGAITHSAPPIDLSLLVTHSSNEQNEEKV